MVLRACRYLMLVLAIGSTLHSWDAAHGQPRGPWGKAPPARSEPIESGFLFLEGQYVAPPYALRVDENTLLVNDIPVQTFAAPEPARPEGRRPGGFAFRSPAREAMVALEARLAMEAVVIHLPGQPEIVFDNSNARCELLKKLIGNEGDLQKVSFSSSLPRDLDMTVWNAWLSSFKPSEDFVDRASGIVELYERTMAQNMAEIGATRRLNTFAYPLSVCGMVLTTVGMGHLLSQRPPVGSKPRETDSTPLALRAAIYSLGLVILFSGLDLAWTILASQAGQMRELNPLGSHLIENPLGLVAFKVGATAMAVGLLLALRKYKRAQLAAWWVCLICTLLTARWVLMNSMFVA